MSSAAVYVPHSFSCTVHTPCLMDVYVHGGGTLDWLINSHGGWECINWTDLKIHVGGVGGDGTTVFRLQLITWRVINPDTTAHVQRTRAITRSYLSTISLRRRPFSCIANSVRLWMLNMQPPSLARPMSRHHVGLITWKAKDSRLPGRHSLRNLRI